jgi:hypothetical protein
MDHDMLAAERTRRIDRLPKIKPLPLAQQEEELGKIASGLQASMPPRENPRINTSLVFHHLRSGYDPLHHRARKHATHRFDVGDARIVAEPHRMSGATPRHGYRCQNGPPMAWFANRDRYLVGGLVFVRGSRAIASIGTGQ